MDGQSEAVSFQENANARAPRKSIAGKLLRWLLLGCALLGSCVALFLLWLLWIAWVPMGHAPGPALQERMAASPQYHEGVFLNSQPMYNDAWQMLTGFAAKSPNSVPHSPIPVLKPQFQPLEQAQRLRVTWLGHSTTVIEIDGVRILTDPIFGPAASPSPALGAERWYAPPAALHHLGKIDVVLISHDHYDHLDQPTMARLRDWKATFVVPLGVAAHLTYWGIPQERIISVDWWDEVEVLGLQLVCTPSRHASGRQVFDQMRTLWASYALIGPHSRVFFSGDTGFFDDLQIIGERFGPFDLTMIEVGAYFKAWPDWHMGPEQAVIAHEMLRGRLFLPIHWGLFDLAMHTWTEPMERVVSEAQRRGVRYLTLRPGEQIYPSLPPAPHKWWPDLPYQTAKQAPIIATRRGNPKERYVHPEPPPQHYGAAH